MKNSNYETNNELLNSNQTQIFSVISDMETTKLQKAEPLDLCDFVELDRLGVLYPQQFEALHLESETEITY